MNDKEINLCDECEFANGSKINKLRTENECLKKGKKERNEKADKFRASMVEENIKFRTENESLRKNNECLDALTRLQAFDYMKLNNRWETLKEGLDTAKEIGFTRIQIKWIRNLMRELEFGGSEVKK